MYISNSLGVFVAVLLLLSSSWPQSLCQLCGLIWNSEFRTEFRFNGRLHVWRPTRCCGPFRSTSIGRANYKVSVRIHQSSRGTCKLTQGNDRLNFWGAQHARSRILALFYGPVNRIRRTCALHVCALAFYPLAPTESAGVGVTPSAQAGWRNDRLDFVSCFGHFANVRRMIKKTSIIVQQGATKPKKIYANLTTASSWVRVCAFYFF